MARDILHLIAGRLEGWEAGRLGGWKDGKLDGWERLA
jgi:hypothetical protein